MLSGNGVLGRTRQRVAGSVVRSLMSVRELPALLRDDPALLEVRGRSSALIAVPEPARAFPVAGLVATTRRRPGVIAVPTPPDAERLAHDLVAFLGADQVDLFPAWETLPFERVSPGVETMGRRLRTIWRLLAPDRAPDVVIAPIRALVQRLGPEVEKVEPVEIELGQRRDRDELVSSLVISGYRREEQVEHRGEVA